MTSLLALAAAACGAMNAILAGVAGRLAGDSRGSWLSVAFGLYSLVGVPAATIGATEFRGDAAVGNLRLFAHTSMAVLFFVVAWGPRMRPPWKSRWILVVGLLLAVAVGLLGNAAPDASLALTTNELLRVCIGTSWLIGGLAIFAVSWVERSRPLSRIGLGCTVIALAHLYRISAGDPVESLGLTFVVVRQLGVLLVLLGVFQLVRGAFRALDLVHSEQREELLKAKIGLQRVSERDHELRNGLAGLAGAADVLTAHPAEAAALQPAVASELARLDALLRRDVGDRPASRPGSYQVKRVLAEQVALRRSSRTDFRVDVDSALVAAGSPETLAQVVANVLTNCARHAPGSAVRIRAKRVGATATIRISDSGPGVPAGNERTVFGVGARGVHSEGQGLGLHVSRRLLHAERGSIHIEPSRPGHRGCTVVIGLPIAAARVDAQSEPLSLTNG